MFVFGMLLYFLFHPLIRYLFFSSLFILQDCIFICSWCKLFPAMTSDLKCTPPSDGVCTSFLIVIFSPFPDYEACVVQVDIHFNANFLFYFRQNYQSCHKTYILVTFLLLQKQRIIGKPFLKSLVILLYLQARQADLHTMMCSAILNFFSKVNFSFPATLM